MSAFTSFLGGFARGTSDTYGEIDKANRDQKQKQDAVIAEAVHKEMQNPERTPEEQHNLFAKYLELNGVKDKKTVAALQDAVGYHRRAMKDISDQSQPTKSLGEVPQVSTPTTTQGPEGAPTVTQPGQELPPVAALPPMPAPPYQPKTVGQLNYEEARPRTLQAEGDKQTLIREAQRMALTGGIEDKIALLHQVENSPDIKDEDKEYYRQLLGVKPKGGANTGKPVNLPGTMNGEAVKAAMDAQGQDSTHIDPKSSYRVTLTGDRSKILSAFETERQTLQGKAGLGSKYIGVFPTDQVGNPVDESGLYFPILARNGGQVIGILPEAALGTQSVRKGFTTVQMKDGTTALVPTTTVTESQKTANGVPVGGAQVAPPVPQAGVAVTTPGEPQVKPTPGPPRSATPSSPLPARAGVGAAIPIPGAGKALTPKEVEDNGKQYQALATTANRVQQVIQNADLFKSLISSSKIQLGMSPSGMLQIGSRYSSLSPKEAHVVALLTSLKEDINTLRGVYQATGFRGPEAFAALTALAGKPLGDPQVTVDLLKQTLESLETQKNVISGTLRDHNLPVPEYHAPSGDYADHSAKLKEIFGKK